MGCSLRADRGRSGSRARGLDCLGLLDQIDSLPQALLVNRRSALPPYRWTTHFWMPPKSDPGCLLFDRWNVRPQPGLLAYSLERINPRAWMFRNNLLEICSDTLERMDLPYRCRLDTAWIAAWMFPLLIVGTDVGTSGVGSGWPCLASGWFDPGWSREHSRGAV